MGEIDLANPDSRKTYLKENLGNLMNGIDSNYGQVLMDELMRRMEATVSEFNEEVKAMLGQLQGKKSTPRDNILASAPRQEPQAPPTPQPPLEVVIITLFNGSADICHKILIEGQVMNSCQGLCQGIFGEEEIT